MRHHYTTILLPTIRLARDGRHRWAAAITVAGLVLFAVGLSWRPRPEPALEPRISYKTIYIVATPSPRPEPTQAPTAEPMIVFATVEVPIVVERYVEAQRAPAKAAPVEQPTAPRALDQSDPACTGARDGSIAAGCGGMTEAQRREAAQR